MAEVGKNPVYPVQSRKSWFKNDNSMKTKDYYEELWLTSSTTFSPFLKILLILICKDTHQIQDQNHRM